MIPSTSRMKEPLTVCFQLLNSNSTGFPFNEHTKVTVPRPLQTNLSFKINVGEPIKVKLNIDLLLNFQHNYILIKNLYHAIESKIMEN